MLIPILSEPVNKYAKSIGTDMNPQPENMELKPLNHAIQS
jgi:hypothetical protein